MNSCNYVSSLLHGLVFLVVQEKQRLDDVLEGRDREIKSLRSYEQQLSAMSHALSKLEAALRQEQEEKVVHQIIRDLYLIFMYDLDMWGSWQSWSRHTQPCYSPIRSLYTIMLWSNQITLHNHVVVQSDHSTQSCCSPIRSLYTIML